MNMPVCDFGALSRWCDSVHFVTYFTMKIIYFSLTYLGIHAFLAAVRKNRRVYKHLYKWHACARLLHTRAHGHSEKKTTRAST